MPQEGKLTSPPDTLSGLLLTLTALSGEFPTALISRLPGGDAYKKKVVKRLKKDRLLHTYYADGLRGLRLTASAKKLLLEGWPDRFCPYLTGRSETNMLKSEMGRRLRLYRMAEVLVTMHRLKGLLYCFDFQEEALSKVCGPNVEIQSICPKYTFPDAEYKAHLRTSF